MRKLALLALLSTFATAALVGCATHPAASSSRSKAAPIDLGCIDQKAHNHEFLRYELSGDRYCLLRLTRLASGQVLVEAPVVQKAPPGKPLGDRLVGRPCTEAWPGERVTLPFDGGELTLTLKAEASQQP